MVIKEMVESGKTMQVHACNVRGKRVDPDPTNRRISRDASILSILYGGNSRNKEYNILHYIGNIIYTFKYYTLKY